MASVLIEGIDPSVYIETCKGRDFYISRPVFDIDEIGFSASKLCRYTGHCRFFYSVAEHSVLVSRLMEELRWGDPLEGFCHDFHETIIADLNSPVKSLLPDYKKLSKQLEKVMRRQYGIPEESTLECRRADWLALLIEAQYMVQSKAEHWGSPPGMEDLPALAKRLVSSFRCWFYTPTVAEAKFKQRWVELTTRKAMLIT